MKVIDLTVLKNSPDEGLLAEMVAEPGVELHFNGRLVWGDIVNAIVAGRRNLAAAHGLEEVFVTPTHLEIALYHHEEKALYIGADYELQGMGRQGGPLPTSAACRVACGPAPRTVDITPVSSDTVLKMLELMDVLDLTRVLWLPLRP